MIKEEYIKEAFSKVKKDIFSLGEEINKLKILVGDMKNELKILTRAFNDLRKKEIFHKDIPTNKPTQQIQHPTNQQKKPTHPTHIPTDKLLSQLLKSQKKDISTGNKGVPTNKQTNQQTNQHIFQQIKSTQNLNLQDQKIQLPTTKTQEKTKLPTTSSKNNLLKIDEILSSLDALKKELRLKIKRLTDQEMNVFSLIYSLENQGFLVDYPLLASKLGLSETSVRDYVRKIKKKGIPLIKEKQNNKKIILHLNPEFKKIASLETILKLREI